MRAIQKQYEKRIKVNTNKDTFTTYQRLSHHQHSPILQEKQRIDLQHHRIESLKCTLQSLSQQASIDLSKGSRAEELAQEAQLEDLEHRKYNVKLDQLFKNLQEIANKDYFSPANAQQRPKSSTYNCTQPARVELQNLEKSQKMHTYQPLRTEHQRPSSNFSHFAASKSQCFIKKDDSYSNSKNNSQNKSIQHPTSSQEQSLWPGKAEFKNNTKKTFSKRDIISQPMPTHSNSKNLTKIFEKFDESMEMPRLRERADTQFRQNPVLFNKNIHRAKITSVLIADHIYTSSLDYCIKKTAEREGDFSSEVVDKFRGGVEHIGLLNGKVFGVGRDCFLRSADGNFHHKFASTPVKFYQSQRSNQASIGFISNEVSLFDLQKRTHISSILANKGYEMMSKWNKQLFIGDQGNLAIIDWRRREQAISLFQCTRSIDHWMCFPFDKQFAYHSAGEIVVLGQKIAKSYSHKLPAGESYKGYDWSRSGLSVLTGIEGTTTAKLMRIRSEREREEMDIEVNGQNLSLVVVRERQIIYAGRHGELLIKRIKK